MESQNNLDTNGSLQSNSPAELLVEIAQVKFNGSLRLSREQEKIAIYFDAGDVIFAVSNARRHRLFELLLQVGKVTKEQLVAIPNFTNDLELKENLLKNNIFESNEMNVFLSRQLSLILKTALEWRVGEWQFSPLVRVKGDIRFSIDQWNLLLEHARHLPISEINQKFVNSQELISAKTILPANLVLSPHESFVFSRFEDGKYTIEQLQNLSGLPGAETERIIYTLWLGGLIVRENWSSAFSEKKKAAILSARLALKKGEQSAASIISPIQEAKNVSNNENINDSADVVPSPVDEKASETKPIEVTISIEDFITRVEQATNFYEIFGLEQKAASSEIKQTYFSLAKRFHPDLFHRETDTKLLQKVQSSFTKLAQAYDTLKTESTREVYDFRMRKELNEMKNMQSSAAGHEEIDQQKITDQAIDNFERGFNLLMDDEFEEAAPYMARAVYLDNSNARYHAYYGKALSTNNKERHKAESELQTAIKLDPENSDYRIMLAEFFIKFNLFKRAEGELKRLLVIFPSNLEAKRLLEKLPKI